MVSGTGLKAVAALGVAAVAVGGTVIARADGSGARAAQAPGGLSLAAAGGIVTDQVAQAGAQRTYRVGNQTKEALKITATARPWTQSASGVVSANRRAKLGGVSVSDGAFTLRPGEAKDVTLTLGSVPARGYLYGALEVVGVPVDLAKRKGVVTGHRLIGALRFNAATPSYRLKAGAAKLTGKGAARTLTLSVRNAGNTLAPVTGRVRLKSAFGTQNGTVKAVRILPGKSVAITLARGTKLRRGSYTATVTLIQNKKSTKVTKKIRVR